jgi:hypothetical protein
VGTSKTIGPLETNEYPPRMSASRNPSTRFAEPEVGLATLGMQPVAEADAQHDEQIVISMPALYVDKAFCRC